MARNHKVHGLDSSTEPFEVVDIVSRVPPPTDSEYNWFREHLLSKTGIALGDGKQLLMEGRLSPRLYALGLTSYGAYLRHLKADKGRSELRHFVDALTTNMTSFFREDDQLHHAREVWEKKLRSETVFVWSAACSSGEEVYSLAMLLEESRGKLHNFDYRILGTDIDTQCLARARRGVYEEQTMSNLPVELRKKYFSDAVSVNPERFCIDESLKSRTKFRNMNLITDGGRSLPLTFHFIYLRNVLIYFEPPTIAQIIRHIEQRLKPGGFLYLGHSETIDLSGTSLVKTNTSCYQLGHA